VDGQFVRELCLFNVCSVEIASRYASQLEFASLHIWYGSANTDCSNMRGRKLHGLAAKVERGVGTGTGNQTPAAATVATSIDG